MEEIPVLDLFFRVHRLMCGRPLERWNAAVSGSFRSPLFLEAMAAWLLCLATHFRVGFQEEAGREWSALSLGSLLAPGASSFLEFGPRMNALSFGWDAWIDALLAGRLASDPASSRLLRARDRIQDGVGIAWPGVSGEVPAEALELDAFYREVLGGEGKLPRVDPDGRQVLDRARARWSFA